jgi:hypothetical protein
MKRFVSTLIAGAASLLLAAPAYAHAMLDHAVPKVGSTVRSAPGEIRLEFSEGVEAVLSRIKLTRLTGETIPLGQPATSPNDKSVLSAALLATLEPGTYQVTWRVVSVDTHVSQGDYRFTVQP